MSFLSIFSLIFYCYVVNVNSLALNGTVLTRYNPCGLGVVYFDKISDNKWQGVINFDLYDLKMINAQMYFAVPVTTYGPPNDTFAVYRSSNYTLALEHGAPIPSKYVFDLQLNGKETSIPAVSRFVINDVVICEDALKDFYSVPSAQVCGRRSMEHTELFSTGTEARAGDWPWHVAILLKDKDDGIRNYKCGGTIVSPSAVLTAGTCIYDTLFEPENVLVVAGTNDYTDVYQPGTQQRLARKLIIHPAFQKDVSTSDLAIVRVSEDFRFTYYVHHICIWGPSYDRSEFYGQEATIAGFGYTENGQPTNILRSANTVVQNDTTCINFAPKVYTNLMNEFTFCAGLGPSHATNMLGDGGGGLVISAVEEDKVISWMLAGVLTTCVIPTNKALCDPSYYAIYTDVRLHHAWISYHAGL